MTIIERTLLAMSLNTIDLLFSGTITIINLFVLLLLIFPHNRTPTKHKVIIIITLCIINTILTIILGIINPTIPTILNVFMEPILTGICWNYFHKHNIWKN